MQPMSSSRVTPRVTSDSDRGAVNDIGSESAARRLSGDSTTRSRTLQLGAGADDLPERASRRRGPRVRVRVRRRSRGACRWAGPWTPGPGAGPGIGVTVMVTVTVGGWGTRKQGGVRARVQRLHAVGCAGDCHGHGLPGSRARAHVCAGGHPAVTAGAAILGSQSEPGRRCVGRLTLSRYALRTGKPTPM